jgi:hypothetical protein
MDIQSCYEHEQFLKQTFKEFNDGKDRHITIDERYQFQALWMFWLCKYKPAQVGTELQNLSELLSLAHCHTIEQLVTQVNPLNFVFFPLLCEEYFQVPMRKFGNRIFRDSKLDLATQY